MIDIHSHILPGIDDGARDVDESLKMIYEAREAGFTDIITTSHYIENSYDVPKARRQILIDSINNNVKGIKLYNGAEAYISNNFCDLIENGTLPTLNGSRYFLFELPMNTMVMNLNEVVFELMAHKYIPIIAHPERYAYVQDDPSMLYELSDRGVLFQSNYGSIIGKYGYNAKRTLKKLLKDDMIQFFGSDAHRHDSVYTQMDEILKKLKRCIGEEKLEELSTYNPSKIIEDERIY